MRVEVEVFGDVQLSRDLLRFAQRANDMEPALDALADDFLAIERQQFSSEGGRSGGWAPLAPDYARTKALQFPGKGILERHGDLRASLTEEGAKGSIRRVTSDELLVGTDVDYAHFHQSGTRKMPRRRVVEFSAGDRRRWVKTLQRYLATGSLA